MGFFTGFLDAVFGAGEYDSSGKTPSFGSGSSSKGGTSENDPERDPQYHDHTAGEFSSWSHNDQQEYRDNHGGKEPGQ